MMWNLLSLALWCIPVMCVFAYECESVWVCVFICMCVRIAWLCVGDHYMYMQGVLLITPRACARGEVIGLSVCCRCCCPQKTRIFRDLQVQASCGRHKTVKIHEKIMYLCSCLLLTIHECDKSWFLYATPIRHTYWGYSIMRHDCACPSSVQVRIVES